MLRVIREVQPRWVVGENVLGLVNWNGGLVFEEVQADLEAEGYEVQPFILPAASVNAPHKRDRVWFVAYASNRVRRSGQENDSSRMYEWESPNTFNEFSKQQIAPDTDSLRHTLCGEGTEAQGIGCGNNGEQKEWSEQAEWSNGLLGLQQYAPDTDSANNKAQPQKRILGEEDEGRKTGRFEYDNTRTMWDKFPTTEPTIRTRNDGFQTRLDSITFSKWRNESIKAAGNAIVPQVVFQIFKAINEYREKYP